MCGLGGVVTFAGQRALDHSDALVRLQRALRHRGPDGQGAFFREELGLVHTRLSLLDLPGGSQPMVSGDGRYVLVYNGEVYEHAALRTQLEWPFVTRSDTETVLAACARWGPAALPKLDGMFSLFFWDTRTRRGFAARDRLGVKPFAYCAGPHGFAFASEAKALLASGFAGRRASEEGILEYLLTPHFSGSHSPFADVSYLPPGHLLHVDPSGARLERWWRWQPRVDASQADDELCAQLEDALSAAVPAALQADVPVGLFLSGGLDSSALAAWGARALDWRGPAFCLAVEGASAASAKPHMILDEDLPHARHVARELGLSLREVSLPRHTLAKRLEQISITDDALPAWEQELSQQALAQAAAREVKAVLVGDAADETHYGYRFLLDPSPSPASLAKSLGDFPLHERHRGALDDLLRKQTQLALDAGHDFRGDVNAWEAMTQLTVERWLPRLLQNGDLHTMACSLEARVPFASPRVLEVAARVGAARGMRRRVGKWALREAARGAVSESIRTRPKSSLPKDAGVARVYQSEVVRLLEDVPACVRHFADLGAIERLARAPVLAEVEQSQLFRFLGLTHWARHYEVEVP